jgi:hypothetical protein
MSKLLSSISKNVALFLDQTYLFRIRKAAEINPIIISLDCHDHATIQVAKSFGDRVKTIIEVQIFRFHIEKRKNLDVYFHSVTRSWPSQRASA